MTTENASKYLPRVRARLQAAADMHANRMQKIDYHGEISTTPAPARARHWPPLVVRERRLRS
jgi:hypothetical protein